MSLGDIAPSGGLDETVADWARLERRYRYASWAGQDATVLTRRHGARRILLTAPHSGHHIRGQWAKPADGGTGGLAEVMAKRIGCAVVTAVGVQADDPNWDAAPGAFKNAALGYLESDPFAFDLHGMNRERLPDICLGTGPAADPASLGFAQYCAAVARAHGFIATINHPFAAAHDGTVTSFFQSRGHRALQVEINVRLLDPEGDPTSAARLVRWLDEILRAVPSRR